MLARELKWALVVFAVAAVTDGLDGWVARHSGQITRLGAMLDPVADKLLTGTAYVLLTWGGVASCPLPVWVTVTLLFRDAMLVAGVVVVNLTVGPIEFPPSRLGKISTALNLLTGAAVLAANATGECPRALVWLYATTVGVLLATTAHYVYLASEHPQRRNQG
jgi:cardiolipin synthase